jgi:hypothetical protein
VNILLLMEDLGILPWRIESQSIPQDKQGKCQKMQNKKTKIQVSRKKRGKKELPFEKRFTSPLLF